MSDKPPITSPNELPLALKVEEVAQLLRCNRKTIYVMVQRKLIPYRYLGAGKRALRFDRGAVLSWLGGTQKGTRDE